MRSEEGVFMALIENGKYFRLDVITVEFLKMAERSW